MGGDEGQVVIKLVAILFAQCEAAGAVSAGILGSDSMTIDRRQFLTRSAALLAGSSLLTLPAWAQPESLRLMFWGGQSRADRTYGVTDLFTAANGTTFESEFMSFSDYWPKLATQVAGGNAPDVIQMDYRYIVEYAKRNAIAPLDDLVGTAIKIDDFDADQLEGGKVDGKLYGISLGANTAAMLINTNAFEEAGIEPPTSDWTYDDLFTLGEAFKAANPRNGMTLISDASYNEPMLENWLRQRGKALYTAEGTLGYQEADMAEWFGLWQRLRDAGICVTADTQALDTGPIASSMLVTGKSALYPAGSNQLVGFQAVMEDKVAIVGYPRTAAGQGGGHYRKPSMFFSITTASQKKELAAEFLNFFISDAGAAEVLGVERGIPASAAMRDLVEPKLDEQNKAAMAFVTNLGDLLGPLPPPPPASAGEIEGALLPNVGQEVGFGARTPEDAAAYYVAEATAILARAQ